jgi:hypothetical protein
MNFTRWRFGHREFDPSDHTPASVLSVREEWRERHLKKQFADYLSLVHGVLSPRGGCSHIHGSSLHHFTFLEHAFIWSEILANCWQVEQRQR